MARTTTEWNRPPALPDDHYVSSQIYVDPELFAEEQDKIFKRTWKLACHESELPNAGDYRTLEWAGTPLVVIRGNDDRIRTFVNICSHRSATVAPGPSGNAKTLVCFFHLWEYDHQGRCIAMPRDEGYKEVGPSKEQAGLREVRTALRLGLVFVNLDDAAPDFDDYAGTAFEHFEEVLGAQPLEVFHYGRVRMRANWKQWHETNIELYHEWGHVVNRTTGFRAPGYFDTGWKLYPGGHGMLLPKKIRYADYKGWDARSTQTMPGIDAGELRSMDLFPNTTIIVRATNIRIDTSTPLAPGLTLLEQRGLGVKGEPAEVRAMRVRDHNQYWGPFGRNVAEDVIFVEAVEQSNRQGHPNWGIHSRRENGGAQDDEFLRHYYAEWRRRMGRSSANPSNRAVALAAE
jgi:methanesulfonate monooxygenase large subunit